MVDWLDRVADEVKKRFAKLYVYRFFGHVIYKPLERTRWKIPVGLTTLKDFLRLAEDRGLEQRRRDHPLALEVYIIFTTDRRLTDAEKRYVKDILEEMVIEAMFHSSIIDYMEFGYEEEVVEEPEPFDAGVRYSRDGVYYEEPPNKRFILISAREKVEAVIKVIE